MRNATWIAFRHLATITTISLGFAFAERSACAADVTQQCASAAGRAQELRDTGKYKAARQELVACGREECPSAIRRDCLGWLNEVNQSSPTIVVRARDAQNADLADVKVTVDGDVVTEKLDGKAILIDPGPHVIRGQIADADAVEQRVIIQTGEKNRLIEISFARSASQRQGCRQEADCERGSACRNGSCQPSDNRTPEKTSVAPWIVGGVGVVSLGAAAYFAASGLADRGDLKSQPCATTSTCPQGDVDRINTKLVIADVTAGVGLVAMGIATYLFLTRSSSDTRSTRGGVFVAVGVGGTGGSVTTIHQF